MQSHSSRLVQLLCLISSFTSAGCVMFLCLLSIIHSPPIACFDILHRLSHSLAIMAMLPHKRRAEDTDIASTASKHMHTSITSLLSPCPLFCPRRCCCSSAGHCHAVMERPQHGHHPSPLRLPPYSILLHPSRLGRCVPQLPVVRSERLNRVLEVHCVGR